VTAPTPEERAADIVVCRFSCGVTIGGSVYRVDRDDVPRIRAAIASEIRAAEAIARAEGRREGLEAARVAARDACDECRDEIDAAIRSMAKETP